MLSPEIITLRKEIEQHIGQSLHTPSDFQLLLQQIWEQLHIVLSLSTIKRLWGYVDSNNRPRLSTLNTLSQFLGYEDWQAYLAALELRQDTESDLFIGEGIRVTDLEPETLIEVSWLPNRQCIFRYLGSNRFEVIESIHAKLQVGDTFEAIAFIIGKPMYLDNLLRQDGTTTSYVAGKRNGITNVQLIVNNAF
jgi:hypothetical protein